jgi:DASS family divalent anion:Na+ symporter
VAHPLTMHLANLNSLYLLVGLCMAYFYRRYLFVSITAQILTLFTMLLSAAVAVGSPRLLAALCFCYLSSFGSGYIDRPSWLRVRLLVSFLTLLIWLTAGIAWWHVLGYW